MSSSRPRLATLQQPPSPRHHGAASSGGDSPTTATATLMMSPSGRLRQSRSRRASVNLPVTDPSLATAQDAPGWAFPPTSGGRPLQPSPLAASPGTPPALAGGLHLSLTASGSLGLASPPQGAAAVAGQCASGAGKQRRLSALVVMGAEGASLLAEAERLELLYTSTPGAVPLAMQVCV